MSEPMAGSVTESMTALTLARLAREANGDCFYENKPVYVRDPAGGFYRIVRFSWDPAVDGFVLKVEPIPVPQVLPEMPDAPAMMIGDHVFCRDDDGGEPVFVCPGGGVCHLTMNWAELNAYAEQERKPIIPLVPAAGSGGC